MTLAQRFVTYRHLSSLRQFVNGAASGGKSLTKRNAGLGSSSTPPSGLQRLTNQNAHFSRDSAVARVESMEDEKVVEAVRGFECLWRVGTKSYRDIIAKENAWKEVAAKSGEGLTAEQCCHRWKTLRDKFVRELEKLKPRSGDAGHPAVSSWPLFQVMSFLTDTVKHKTTATNFTLSASNNVGGSMTDAFAAVSDALQEELDSSTTEGSATGATESTPAQLISDTTARRTAGSKRKRSENGDEVEKALLLRLQTLQQDGEAAFVEHVAASLRQLNPRERAIAKIEIDKILFKVQYSEDVL